MPCYFLHDGHIVGVEMLPLGISDNNAIARAHTLYLKRKGPLDGFEVWDRARFVSQAYPIRRAAATEFARIAPALLRLTWQEAYIGISKAT